MPEKKAARCPSSGESAGSWQGIIPDGPHVVLHGAARQNSRSSNLTASSSFLSRRSCSDIAPSRRLCSAPWRTLYSDVSAARQTRQRWEKEPLRRLVSAAEVLLVPVVAEVSDLPGCLSPPLFSPNLLQYQFLFSFFHFGLCQTAFWTNPPPVRRL